MNDRRVGFESSSFPRVVLSRLQPLWVFIQISSFFHISKVLTNFRPLYSLDTLPLLFLQQTVLSITMTVAIYVKNQSFSFTHIWNNQANFHRYFIIFESNQRTWKIASRIHSSKLYETTWEIRHDSWIPESVRIALFTRRITSHPESLFPHIWEVWSKIGVMI